MRSACLIHSPCLFVCLKHLSSLPSDLFPSIHSHCVSSCFSVPSSVVPNSRLPFLCLVYSFFRFLGRSVSPCLLRALLLQSALTTIWLLTHRHRQGYAHMWVWLRGVGPRPSHVPLTYRHRQGLGCAQFGGLDHVPRQQTRKSVSDLRGWVAVSAAFRLSCHVHFQS